MPQRRRYKVRKTTLPHAQKNTMKYYPDFNILKTLPAEIPNCLCLLCFNHYSYPSLSITFSLFSPQEDLWDWLDIKKPTTYCLLNLSYPQSLRGKGQSDCHKNGNTFLQYFLEIVALFCWSRGPIPAYIINMQDLFHASSHWRVLTVTAVVWQDWSLHDTFCNIL